jgi:membrane-associated phospholipid phosphatase
MVGLPVGSRREGRHRWAARVGWRPFGQRLAISPIRDARPVRSVVGRTGSVHGCQEGEIAGPHAAGRHHRRWHRRVERGAEAHGLGLVSGHVAVATALTLVAWPWLPRWGRWAAAAAVTAVFFTRMYVGAHLPLDMIGGAFLGLAVAGAVRLLLGTPAATARRGAGSSA